MSDALKAVDLGRLRTASAYADSRTPVVVVTDDEQLKSALYPFDLQVLEVYPDGTNGGEFKVKVALRRR